MVYEYVCEVCGNREERDYRMDDKRPKRLMCPKCKKESMYRFYGDKALNIPDTWNDTSYKFDKSPSGKKHFY